MTAIDPVSQLTLIQLRYESVRCRSKGLSGGCVPSDNGSLVRISKSASTYTVDLIYQFLPPKDRLTDPFPTLDRALCEPSLKAKTECQFVIWPMCSTYELGLCKRSSSTYCLPSRPSEDRYWSRCYISNISTKYQNIYQEAHI